jgi:hypothetical protein
MCLLSVMVVHSIDPNAAVKFIVSRLPDILHSKHAAITAFGSATVAEAGAP